MHLLKKYSYKLRQARHILKAIYLKFYFLYTSLSSKSGRRQRWAQSRENSRFMWINRPWSMILNTAKRISVNARHPINTKQAVFVTVAAVSFLVFSISGIGRGVGVVGGGTIYEIDGEMFRGVLIYNSWISYRDNLIISLTYQYIYLPLQLIPFDTHIYTWARLHHFRQYILLRPDKATVHRGLKLTSFHVRRI